MTAVGPATQIPVGSHTNRILLVDDNATNLQLLYQTLDGCGYELLVATNGENAISIAREAQPNLILLDIMMPGIDGFETCRQLKFNEATRDAAIIFMSALDDTNDKVRGLDLGAIDYITKPFQAEEVIARVDTHLTIQQLQRRLTSRNLELNTLNDRMKNNLEAAARVQRSLLPSTLPESEKIQFAWTYQPCDELAGDSLGIFRIDEQHIGMYVLDVVGHGVPAALLSVAATHRLRPSVAKQSIIARSTGDDHGTTIVPPTEVANQLNQLFPMADSDNRFFTMVYVVINTHNGYLRYSAAGHPGPLIQRADGTTESLDSTGLPIGVIDEYTYEGGEAQLQAGDRVYLYSDGVFEEMNEHKELFGFDRFLNVLTASRSASLEDGLSHVIASIKSWSKRAAFTDDVTIVATELTAGPDG